MALFRLLVILASTSAIGNVAVEAGDTRLLDDLGLLGSFIRLAGNVRDFLKATFFTSGVISPTNPLPSSLEQGWFILERVANVRDVLQDWTLQGNIPRIIQVVQTLPKMAIECLVTQISDNLKEVGPSLDVVLLAFNKVHLLDLDQLQKSFSQKGWLKFLSETLPPVFTQGLVLIFTNANLHASTMELLHWFARGLGSVLDCVLTYLRRSLRAPVETIAKQLDISLPLDELFGSEP